MKFPLDIPAGDRQQSLIDCFNVALGKRMRESSSESQLLNDGTFVSTVAGRFIIDGGDIPTTWTFSARKDGTLSWIEACLTDTAAESSSWEHAIRDFTIGVLSSALRDSRDAFFHDFLFYYVGAPLDGEYWLPGFRLGPALPDDRAPEWFAERVASIALTVSGIDAEKAGDVAQEKATRIAARLSLILNVGFYKRIPEKRWVSVPSDDGSASEARRVWVGLVEPKFRLSSMPKKGEICPLGQYGGSLDQRRLVDDESLSLPRETRRLLRAFDELEPALRSALDGAARLTQLSLVLKPRYPSLSLAYQVAAIEAIAGTVGKCTSFSELARLHLPHEEGLDDALETLYRRVRSAHFHAGEFPLGEFDALSIAGPLTGREVIERWQLRPLEQRVLRRVLVSWVRSILPKSATYTSE